MYIHVHDCISLQKWCNYLTTHAQFKLNCTTLNILWCIYMYNIHTHTLQWLSYCLSTIITTASKGRVVVLDCGSEHSLYIISSRCGCGGCITFWTTQFPWDFGLIPFPGLCTLECGAGTRSCAAAEDSLCSISRECPSCDEGGEGRGGKKGHDQ